MPSNPFQLLAQDDDEEDLGTAVKAPEEPKVSKPAQQAPSGKGTKAPKEAKPVADKEAAPKQNQAPRQRNNKPRTTPQANQENTQVSGDVESFDKPKTDRRPARGHGREGREGYNPRNERHSHQRTQKTGERGEKKEGHGVGNWGSTKEEIVEEAKATAVVAEVETPAAEETVEAPKEEEAKTLSFDEFKKQKQSKRATAPALPSARKAGEGEDNARWGDAQELVKEEVEEEESSDKTDNRKAQRAYKKQTVSIDVQFEAKERSEPTPSRDGIRGGRGGRGGSRGGPRNSNRGSRSNVSDNKAAPAFNVSEFDFPKL